MNHPDDPRSIQPDERSYGIFAPALLPELEPLRQTLIEMQHGVAPNATATARITLLQKALADTQEQDDPANTPETRAALQCILAIAYQQCLDGDRAQQMETALRMCQEALQVYTLAQYPYQYASLQVTLGNVYRERAVGAQRDNLDRSVSSYLAALLIYTLEEYPYEYAQAQDGLGQTYQLRIEGERQKS